MKFMIQFDIITIFPEIFNSYLKESLISRGQKKKLIKINIHNLRRWTKDRRKTVDDRPFGGGLGMVLKIEPIYRAVQFLRSKKLQIKNLRFTENLVPRSARNKNYKLKTILFTPRGKKFDQKIAYQLSKLDKIIMICGRYEGVDERVAQKLADMELSIGEYDLMGGELPAMIVIETVSRLVPGVLGKEELLKERITKEKGFIEYPHYTRPEVFTPKKGIKWVVPKILLSGHHKKIGEWREKRKKEVGN